MTILTNKIIATLAILCGVALLIARIPTNTVEVANAQSDAKFDQIATTTKATTTEKTVKTTKIQKKKKLFIEVKVPENLSPYTNRVLTDLLKCESGYNALALNAVDRDNTPSFGALQFKPTTWTGVLQKYYDPNITPEQAFLKIFDGDLQVKVWVLWFEDGVKTQAWWDNQFPDCAKKYGYWK